MPRISRAETYDETVSGPLISRKSIPLYFIRDSGAVTDCCTSCRPGLLAVLNEPMIPLNAAGSQPRAIQRDSHTRASLAAG